MPDLGTMLDAEIYVDNSTCDTQPEEAGNLRTCSWHVLRIEQCVRRKQETPDTVINHRCTSVTLRGGRYVYVYMRASVRTWAGRPPPRTTTTRHASHLLRRVHSVQGELHAINACSTEQYLISIIFIIPVRFLCLLSLDGVFVCVYHISRFDRSVTFISSSIQYPLCTPPSWI